MLIRYPGSKDRLARDLVAGFPWDGSRRLCEPFAGTAAVSFAALRQRRVNQVWLNDVDRGICDLWSSVRDQPHELADLIRSYIPQVEDFYAWREADDPDPVVNAFRTVVLHQISYSGLGRKAGSPIGGRDQLGEYPVGCRWNGGQLALEVGRLHRLLARAEVTVNCGDWAGCPDGWAWFVDPPYIEAGRGLYRHGELNHAALAGCLRSRSAPWLLTYDDHPEVRRLYGWGVLEPGLRTYLNHGGAQAKTELIISRAGEVNAPTLFGDAP